MDRGNSCNELSQRDERKDCEKDLKGSKPSAHQQNLPLERMKDGPKYARAQCAVKAVRRADNCERSTNGGQNDMRHIDTSVPSLKCNSRV